MNFTTCVYPFDNDGAEWEVEVRVDYDADYQSEYIGCSSENCRPAVGDMTINSIEVVELLPRGITEQDMAYAIRDAVVTGKIDEAAWEDYHSRGSDENS